MKFFLYFPFIFTISVMLMTCGGGSPNLEEVQPEVSTDSTSQNTLRDAKKIIEEIPRFENAKFDEAIFN